jgi:hypothetical protein
MIQADRSAPNRRLFRMAFLVVVAVKGLDGVIETVAGIAVAILGTEGVYELGFISRFKPLHNHLAPCARNPEARAGDRVAAREIVDFSRRSHRALRLRGVHGLQTCYPLFRVAARVCVVRSRHGRARAQRMAFTPRRPGASSLISARSRQYCTRCC